MKNMHGPPQVAMLADVESHSVILSVYQCVTWLQWRVFVTPF